MHLAFAIRFLRPVRPIETPEQTQIETTKCIFSLFAKPNENRVAGPSAKMSLNKKSRARFKHLKQIANSRLHILQTNYNAKREREKWTERHSNVFKKSNYAS